ncbi:MAG: hypothetical protein E7178_05155 [Erysipelotrichaceae bacterium]|nr:hypothetical protein [Erysipelotrichaceae bacterium]
MNNESSDILIYAYFFVGGALFLLVLLGLVASSIFPTLNKRSKVFFISSFSLMIISIIAYVIDVLIYTNPTLAWVERIIAFIETLLPSLLMPILTVYVLHCCNKNIRKNPIFYINIALCLALFVLLIIAQLTDAIYYFTDENEFIRGDFYWVLIAPMLALIAINLGQIIYRRKELGKKYFIAFLIYLLPVLIIMTLQTFISVFIYIVIAVSISALSMFGIIMTDQIEQYLRQQKEIADQKASIAVLQMRPHFIYNTMTSIYYLCEQDPKKAQQVTLDFTTYLRKNFNAITGKEPIPFVEELEHTRAYLAVVQAQYEDNLLVEFDTPHTQFRVPPLTLQPLVENSVKYGLNIDSTEPLRVSVRTEKVDNGSVIIVSDTGHGIANKDNGEPHIALNNIRERLSAIKGTLTISPNENGGTIVSIYIPDNNE